MAVRFGLVLIGSAPDSGPARFSIEIQTWKAASFTRTFSRFTISGTDKEFEQICRADNECVFWRNVFAGLVPYFLTL